MVVEDANKLNWDLIQFPKNLSEPDHFPISKKFTERISYSFIHILFTYLYFDDVSDVTHLFSYIIQIMFVYKELNYSSPSFLFCIKIFNQGYLQSIPFNRFFLAPYSCNLFPRLNNLAPLRLASEVRSFLEFIFSIFFKFIIKVYFKFISSKLLKYP